jgi:hypothetical protein
MPIVKSNVGLYNEEFYDMSKKREDINANTLKYSITKLINGQL